MLKIMNTSMKFVFVSFSFLLSLVVLPSVGQARFELVMFEEIGCAYCEQWKADVGIAYPRTPEGRAAPLRIVNLDRAMPEDLDLESRPVFSPTFVLVDEGVEVTRIEGYPGEEFFWFMLGEMLDEGDANWAELAEVESQ